MFAFNRWCFLPLIVTVVVLVVVGIAIVVVAVDDAVDEGTSRAHLTLRAS